MIKKLITISFIAGSLILSGCTNSRSEDYSYKPNTLSKEMVNVLHNYVRESNQNDTDTKVEFIEKQSLLKFTVTNDDDRFVFGTGIGGKYFDKLCNGTEPFYVSIRENGIGLQFDFVDHGIDSFGPWNSDACPTPSQ